MPWNPTASVWFDDCLEAQPSRPRKRLDGATDRPLTLDFLSLFQHPLWPDSPGAPLRRVPTQRDLGSLDLHPRPIPDAEPHSALWPQQEPPARRKRQRQAPDLFRYEILPSDPEPPESATSGTAPGRRPRRSPPADLDMPGRFFDFTWTDENWPAVASADPSPQRLRRPDLTAAARPLATFDAQSLEVIPAADADRMPRRPRPVGGVDATPSEALAPQTRLRTFVVEAMPRGRLRQPQAGQEVIVSAQVLREAWPVVVEVIEGNTPRRGSRPLGEGGTDEPPAARMPGPFAFVVWQDGATRQRRQAPGDLAQPQDGSWVLAESLGALWHGGESQRPIGRRPAQPGATVWVHFSRWTGPEMSDLQAAPPLPMRSRPVRPGTFAAGIDADLGAGPELLGWLQSDPERPQRTRQGQSESHAEPSWLGAGVIVVAGPYGAVAAEVYTAGAVAAVLSQEG